VGAITSRLSVDIFPLQQITPALRGCLRSDPGFVLVTSDLSQVEVRIGAALSGDENLIRAAAQESDVYTAIAKLMFGKSATKDQRNIAKRAVLGRFYGAGIKTVAQQCGVSYPVAKKALETLDQQFPGVKLYAQQLSHQDYVIT
jgi:DNA polymerase-1